jgi:hypothetical protein
MEKKKHSGYIINDPIKYIKYKWNKERPQVDLDVLIDMVKSDSDLFNQVVLEMNAKNDLIRRKISKQFTEYIYSLTPEERIRRAKKAAENRDSVAIALARWENTDKEVRRTHMDPVRILAYELFDSRRTERYNILLEEIPNGWISKKDWEDWYAGSIYAKEWGHCSGAFIGQLISDPDYFESQGIHNHKKYRKFSNNPSDEIMYNYIENYASIRDKQYKSLLEEIPNGWIDRLEWMEWFNNSKYKQEWGSQNASIISTLIQDSHYFEQKEIEGDIRYRKLSDNPSDEWIFSKRENKLEKRKGEKLEQFEILLQEIPNGWITRNEWMGWFKSSKYIKEWGLKSNSGLMNELLNNIDFFERSGEGSYKKYRKISDNPSEEIMFSPSITEKCKKCGELHNKQTLTRFHNDNCLYDEAMRLYNALPQFFTFNDAILKNKEFGLKDNICRKLVQSGWLNLISIHQEGKMGGASKYLRIYKKR